MTILPRPAPLATHIQRLGLPDTTSIWAALWGNGFIECYATPTHCSVQLTPLGVFQAQHYAPPTVAPDKEVWLYRVLCHLFRVVPSPIPNPPVSLLWDQVRTRYPAQWVVLAVTRSHTEGSYILPDRMVVCAAHPNYAEAHAYYQPFSLSPIHLLTHTSSTTLVLQYPHPCYV